MILLPPGVSGLLLLRLLPCVAPVPWTADMRKETPLLARHCTQAHTHARTPEESRAHAACNAQDGPPNDQSATIRGVTGNRLVLNFPESNNLPGWHDYHPGLRRGSYIHRPKLVKPRVFTSSHPLLMRIKMPFFSSMQRVITKNFIEVRRVMK
jgi:hypothetical protein